MPEAPAPAILQKCLLYDLQEARWHGLFFSCPIFASNTQYSCCNSCVSLGMRPPGRYTYCVISRPFLSFSDASGSVGTGVDRFVADLAAFTRLLFRFCGDDICSMAVLHPCLLGRFFTHLHWHGCDAQFWQCRLATCFVAVPVRRFLLLRDPLVLDFRAAMSGDRHPSPSGVDDRCSVTDQPNEPSLFVSVYDGSVQYLEG